MTQSIKYHFLEGRARGGYVTFGAPWKQGEVKKNAIYDIELENGTILPVQSKISAYWPDGSVKWSLHTAKVPQGNSFDLIIRDKNEDDLGFKNIIAEDNGVLRASTGKMELSVIPNSNKIFQNVVVCGNRMADYGKLVYIEETRQLEEQSILARKETEFIGYAHKVIIEENGPLKAVLKLEGIHMDIQGNKRIPFIVRLIFYRNSEKIKLIHTFFYDGDPQLHYMKGIGIEISSPISGELWNRHIKIGGDNGYLHEMSQLLLGGKPKIPIDIYEKQIKGEFIVDQEKLADCRISISDATVWDIYKLYQSSSDCYKIEKGTGKDRCCTIHAVSGKRAGGIVAAGGIGGGIAVAKRDFWKKYPSGMEVRDLSKDNMRITTWIYTPEHAAYDFRHYDTVGHKYAYYEGFDEAGGDPYGIANTNEMSVYLFEGSIPEDAVLDTWKEEEDKSPVAVADPEYYHKLKVFGEWSMVDRSSHLKNWLETQLDTIIDFYKVEVEQRKWYGLFDYGDFMHSYDNYRHCWRYDMGGYAWQNTELVPTMWLWYTFLRTQREDIFCMAEAMTRHTSEVDTYHFGRYKGIGSRHNVIHWGCACKEVRIAMAGHHRIYYYLTGDNRITDVFNDVRDADYTVGTFDPLRECYDKKEMLYPTHARTGPDWSSFCANWMTEWERTGNIEYMNKIKTGIADLKRSPSRMVSGADYEYDPETSHLRYIGEKASGGLHLAICMGAPQIWFELVDLLEDEEFKEMLIEFGTYYFLTPEERDIKSKGKLNGKEFPLQYMASAMGAYSAKYHNKEGLGKRIWEILLKEWRNSVSGDNLMVREISSYVTSEKLYEVTAASTNFFAQWSLNVIVCLELIGEYLGDMKLE